MRPAIVFLYSYSELHRQAASRGVHAWQIVPKLHQMHHIILDAVEDRDNPRFFHCFGDGDMVGKMLVLARAGHALTIVSSAVNNYILGLVHRLRAQ